MCDLLNKAQVENNRGGRSSKTIQKLESWGSCTLKQKKKSLSLLSESEFTKMLSLILFYLSDLCHFVSAGAPAR